MSRGAERKFKLCCPAVTRRLPWKQTPILLPPTVVLMKKVALALTLLAVPALSQPSFQLPGSQSAPGAASRRTAVLTPETPDCNAVDLVPNMILLTWPDVPTEDTLASLPNGTTTLLVHNVSTETVTYELEGLFVADGQRLNLSLGTGVLSPGSTTSVPIQLTGFGVNLFDLDFSGSLIVQTPTKDTSGALLDRSYSPVVFFHQEATGAFFLYGREARHAIFFAGDLKNRFFSTVPPASVMGVFDGGAGTGSESEDSGPPDNSGPANNGEWEFCMRWIYESIDSGFGEDYYQQGMYMKARGMKVVIDHPNWGAPQIFYANKDNGCFTFPSTENSGFEVTIFAEARLGTNDDITIQSCDTKQQAYNDDVASWYQVVNPGGLPRRIYLQNEASEESSIMAFGSFMFHWIDSQTSPSLAGPKKLQLLTDNPTCEGSCQPGDYVEMKPGAGNRKFLVGHEVGHWMHRKWSITLGASLTAYDDNAGGPNCAFDGLGSHAMRSRETAAGAFIEGFAHYLSSIAWNDH
ncbi:MAG: hypothetical protein ACI9F9_002366, partial [Candidatus Paceibacteria bacterium]